MTDIAIRNGQHLDIPTGTEPAAAQLVQWAQAANAAYQFAEVVCNSQAVPSSYRGKPQEAAAAILAGAEVGLSPMASLRAFDNIQGTSAPKAITLRAIIQGRGHDLEVIEADARHAIVEGRRKGSDRWQRLEWTIERATSAGYVAKNPKWKSDPTSMLVARATSEMARWIDSAAIMGMPYSAEEIRDKGAAIEARPEPRRVTAAEILGSASESETVPPAESEDDASESRQASDGDSDAVAMVNPAQRNKMFGLWDDLGFSGDENRANRLTITAKILGLQEPLESSNDLTFDEAETVIAALVERKAAQDKAAQGGES